MPVELVAQAAFNGLISGLTIALAALGLNLVFAIERFANVAQGDFLTVGAYWFLLLYVGLALPLVPASILGIAGTAAVVYVVHRVAFEPLARGPRVTLLVASIGAGLVLRSLIGFTWGGDLQTYGLPITRGIEVGPVRLVPVDIAIAGLSVGAMVVFWWILAKTRLGREMRAVADVPDLAVISGIDRRRVVRAVWIITGALSGLAGILLGAKVGITPLMGWSMLLPSFAAAILGGVGSPAGAVLGGILFGIAAELSTFLVSPSYKVAIAFLVMTIVLLLRPTGLIRGLSRS